MNPLEKTISIHTCIDGNVVFDSKDLPKNILPSTALWSEPLGPHTLKNTGNKNLHIISVEIKK